MPSKGNQRASRQAQLRNRKRKSAKSHVVDSRVTENPRVELEVDTTNQVRQEVTKSQTKTVQQKTNTNVSTSNVLTYEYLGGEIKRIGIAAAVIVALLIALSFSSIAT